jgi:Tfp pilus assembly protein PilX
MTEALIVSNIILWVVVIALALLVLALARQVGILHERVSGHSNR